MRKMDIVLLLLGMVFGSAITIYAMNDYHQEIMANVANLYRAVADKQDFSCSDISCSNVCYKKSHTLVQE